MSSRYVKIFPTTDDIGKIPVVVADSEGINGVSISFLTTSQLLTSAKYKGEITETGLSEIDTSAYTGGEWIMVTDIPTIKIWSATLEAWV